jgi:hypothetical protein
MVLTSKIRLVHVLKFCCRVTWKAGTDDRLFGKCTTNINILTFSPYQKQILKLILILGKHNAINKWISGGTAPYILNIGTRLR